MFTISRSVALKEQKLTFYDMLNENTACLNTLAETFTHTPADVCDFSGGAAAVVNADLHRQRGPRPTFDLNVSFSVCVI